LKEKEMIKFKSKVVSIAIMAIATVFMVSAIWTDNISRSTRPVIVLSYLLLMMVAMLISGKRAKLMKK
jgi:hypothetical protein